MSASLADQEEGHIMPFKAEYARSGRSHCKKCDKLIDDQDLRICTQVKSRLFDGMQNNWYHSDCFFERYHPTEEGEIENFDELRNEDKKLIQKRLKSISARELSPGHHSVLEDFKVEYPKTGKSICPACEESISEDEPRIGKVDYESENSRRFGPIFRYHHVECFTKLRDDFGFNVGGEQLPGFDTLEKHDQDYIKKKLPKNSGKKRGGGQKRERSDSPTQNELAYLKRSKQRRSRRDQYDEENHGEEDEGMSRSQAGKKGAEARSQKQQNEEDMEEEDFKPQRRSATEQRGAQFGGMSPQEAGRKGGLARGGQQQERGQQDSYDEEGEEDTYRKPRQYRGGQRSGQQFGGMSPQEAGRKGGLARGRQQRGEDQDHGENEKPQRGKMSRSEAGKKGAQARYQKQDEDQDEDDFHPHEGGRQQARRQDRGQGQRFGGMTPQEAGRKGGQQTQHHRGRGRKRTSDEDELDEFPRKRRGDEYVSDDDYPNPVVPDDEADDFEDVEMQDQPQRARRQAGRKRRVSDQDEQLEDVKELKGEVAALKEDIRRWDATGMASTRPGRKSPEAAGPKVPGGLGSSRGQGVSLEEEIEKAGYKVRRPGQEVNYSDDENFGDEDLQESGLSGQKSQGRRRAGGGQRMSRTEAGRKGGSRSNVGRRGQNQEEEEYTPDEDEEHEESRQGQRSRGGQAGGHKMSMSERGKKGAAARYGKHYEQEHDEDEKTQPRGQRQDRGQFGGMSPQEAGRKGGQARGRQQRGQETDEDEEDQGQERRSQGQRGKQFGGMSPQEAGRKGGLARGRQQRGGQEHEDYDEDEKVHHDQYEQGRGRRTRPRQPFHGEHSGEIDEHTHEILSNLGKKAAQARISGHHDDPQYRANSEERKALSLISHLGNRSAIGKKGAAARWGHHESGEEHEDDQEGQGQQHKMSRAEAGRRGGRATQQKRDQQHYDEEEDMDVDERAEDQGKFTQQGRGQGMSRSEAGKKGAAVKRGKNSGQDEVDDGHETDEYPDEKVVARQNKKYYAIKDAIMYAHNNQEFNKNDMIAFLKFNNGEEPHTGDLYDELADVIAYGALKNCPNCKKGTFVYKSSIGCYECTADCDYRTDDPPRVPFKIPGDLGNIEFLKKFKTDSTERRAIPHHARPDLNASTLKPYQGPKISKFPLEHFTFFVEPSIRTRQLDQKLRTFGGRIASNTSSKRTKIAVIISTKEIVQAKQEDYVKFAKENSIPIVSPEYYDDLNDVDFNILDAIEKHLICDWMDRNKIQEHLTAIHTDFKSPDEHKPLKIEKDSDIPLVTSVIDVDPDSGLEREAQVYKEVGGHYCSEILSKVDVDAGQNKYYKLQVLVSKRGHKRFWLFRAWGRYGTTIGNHKCEEMTKEAALSMFKSIYNEKTGNIYGEKRVIRRGHYFPLKLQQDEGTREKLVPNARTSKLPMPVQTLISRIFDIDLMKQTLLDHHVDVKEVPLGQLDQEEMLEAYKILGELLEAVREEKQNRRKIVELTNYFYTLIPHNFGNDEIPLLDNEEIVQRKVLLMENILEIDIAYDLLVGTGRHHESPIDARYAALDADINVLEQGSELWKQLEFYLQNTHAEQHNDFTMEVVNICTINRDSEETRFSRFIPYSNRRLLWHGTRVSNLASIIYRGLKVAPPIAPATGYMFGKGIYFADCASKAANFLLINKKPLEAVSSGFLLLCDVALGSMATLTKGNSSLTKPPDGKDSIFAAGRYQPDPSQIFKVPSGAVVHCGKLREVKLDDPDPDLNFNEYVIYDEDQVKIEYIVEVNFHLK